MKKRLKRGFTVVEVLVATAILAIFASMAIVGTSALFGTGEEMMAVSKAAVLGSDVMKAITNEVRFGREFTEKDGAISYNSTTHGDGCSIQADANGQLAIVQTSSKDVFGSGTATSTKTYYPIGTAAYDEVRIQAITFTIGESGSKQTISCTLAITSDNVNTLWEKTVIIVPLYQKATT